MRDGAKPRAPFLELKPGHPADEAALRAWCRDHLVPYKAPGRDVFAEILRTSTGKIRKFVPREQARG
jgi:fatty-acyl-CoA synthase